MQAESILVTLKVRVKQSIPFFFFPKEFVKWMYWGSSVALHGQQARFYLWTKTWNTTSPTQVGLCFLPPVGWRGCGTSGQRVQSRSDLYLFEPEHLMVSVRPSWTLFLAQQLVTFKTAAAPSARVPEGPLARLSYQWIRSMSKIWAFLLVC